VHGRCSSTYGAEIIASQLQGRGDRERRRTRALLSDPESVRLSGLRWMNCCGTLNKSASQPARTLARRAPHKQERKRVLVFNSASSHCAGLLCGLTFELSGRRRQDARPGPVKMYRVPPARAWWPAVGAPLERGVRPRLATAAHVGLPPLQRGLAGSPLSQAEGAVFAVMGIRSQRVEPVWSS
jgi:hypothetical protein